MNFRSDSLISIVIPCYNQGHFLSQAISSCLAQTYPHREIIVVDDGSRDDTRAVANRFPVRYIYQPNQGLSSARNAGIAASRGAFVVFLDSDDRLLPDALEIGFSQLQADPECVMSAGNHRFIREGGDWIRNSEKPVREIDDPYLALLRCNFIENPACVMYRRTVFDVVGGFDTSLKAAEDYELYLRITRRFKVCLHEKFVSEYRLHGASMSRNPELMLTTTLHVLRHQADYADGSEGRRKALREGLSLWRRQYGRQLAIQLARWGARSDGQAVGRKLGALLREYPIGLLFALIGRFLPATVLSACEKRRLRAPNTREQSPAVSVER